MNSRLPDDLTEETQVPYPEHPYDENMPFVKCEVASIQYFETAPVQFQVVQEVPLSPDRLFDVFEDPASWPQWVLGITGVEWTSPMPYRVGTTRTVFFNGGMKVYEEFIAWERGHTMAFMFYGTTQLIWKQFGEHYTVKDLGDNRCELTWTVAYEPAGTFAKLHGLIKTPMKYVLKSYMRSLAKYCKKLN